MRPAEMAALLHSPGLIIVVWVIAGVFNLCTAMVIAELGAMLPETGGEYAFMRRAYGDFWAYLFGWANFAVINTAGTAGVAFIFSQYAEYFYKLPRFTPDIERSVNIYVPMIGNIFPLENIGVKMLTILILGLLTLLNFFSTKLGAAVQVFFTGIKILAILLLTAALFFSGKGEVSHLVSGNAALIPSGLALIMAMVAASNGALQAYDGWANLVHVAGEIKTPGRNIPLSLFAGLGACMVIYVLTTLSLMYILPVDTMAGSSLVAADAAFIAFGSVGGGIVAALICISVLGTSNASVLSPPRMTFAMAREGNFFRFAGKIHPRFQTPGNALWLHYLVMVVMVFSGSFYVLTDMYIFIIWLFNFLLLYSVFIFRKKMPEANRPYKVRGYPWLPFILILCNAFYLVVTLYNDISNYANGKTNIINSVFGVVLTAIGIPLYWLFDKRKNKQV
jgi:APA family basic amino acid/polyamine antiporter